MEQKLRIPNSNDLNTARVLIPSIQLNFMAFKISKIETRYSEIVSVFSYWLFSFRSTCLQFRHLKKGRSIVPSSFLEYFHCCRISCVCRFVYRVGSPSQPVTNARNLPGIGIGIRMHSRVRSLWFLNKPYTK